MISRHAFVIAITLLALAACDSFRDRPVHYARNPGPPVSAECLALARRHALVSEAPSQVGRFAVTSRGRKTLGLEAPGRALTDAEIAALFHAGLPKAVSTGGYSCDTAPRTKCMRFAVWLCQTSLTGFIAEVEQALAKVNASDAGFTLELEVIEPGGSRCRPGSECRPLQHGSTHGTYDPDEPRYPVAAGQGPCDDDGECDGSSNACVAWYLIGGVNAEGWVQYKRPTFCGCVDHACAWFVQ